MTPPDAPSGEAPTPSAAELLAEVAKRVAEKKAAGDYDPAEMQRVEAAAVDFAAAPAEDGYQAELALHLDHLRELWDPQAFGVTTHRAGTAGRLIVAVKRLVHRLTAPLTAIWLARQVRFNDHLVKLLLNLLPRHHDLRHRMGHNEGRLDALEEQARAAAVSLADQGRQLHAGLDGLGDRAARNERGWASWAGAWRGWSGRPAPARGGWRSSWPAWRPWSTPRPRPAPCPPRPPGRSPPSARPAGPPPTWPSRTSTGAAGRRSKDARRSTSPSSGTRPPPPRPCWTWAAAGASSWSSAGITACPPGEWT